PYTTRYAITLTGASDDGSEPEYAESGDEETNKYYTCADLPVFYRPASEPVGSLSEILANEDAESGAGGYNYNSYGYEEDDASSSRFSMVNLKSQDFSSDSSLIAFYHPAHRQRLDNVLATIESRLDVAPAQVYIESMVLEVSEQGMDSLGVLYSRTLTQGDDGSANITIGQALAQTPNAAIDGGLSNFAANVLRGGDFSLEDALQVQIEAMIAEGKAEILSRPSILALDNRPAVIEVGEQKQYSVRETTSGYGGAVGTSYRFQEVTPGILLQLRPRISKNRQEVGMEIDIQVKALVAANNGQALNEEGTAVIATKPGSSTRRVHTFALVGDTTPIIIGGLVARENEEVVNEVPGLSRVPVLGKLFSAKREAEARKEVVVVITPHIIKSPHDIGVHSPKDSASFDDLDTRLFRYSYRIRSEDVYDLGFLYNSPQFQYYRNLALTAPMKGLSAEQLAVVRQFDGDSFPGSDALVSRMIYSLVRKNRIAESVATDNMVVAQMDAQGGFDEVERVLNLWKSAKSGGKALRLEFQQGDSANRPINAHARVSFEPVDDDRFAATGSAGQTVNIVIREEKDMERLRQAIAVREVILLNGDSGEMAISSISRGRKIQFPTLTPERGYLVDYRVAKIFNEIKNYYHILEAQLQNAYQQLDAVAGNLE
ncbi:MAG: type II and III secretion system protein, partial [Pseudomonadales bacterium]|nr:type II and III secretion system protein [Pseudomonadales bacterium]